MGISRRKVWTIVRCPKCSGQVVVPHGAPDQDDEPPTGTDHPALKSLDDPELEAMLAGAAREAAGLQKPPKRKKIPEVDVEVIPMPGLAPGPPPAYADAPFPAPAAPFPPMTSVPDPIASNSPPTSWAKTPVTITAPRWAMAVAALAAALVLGVTFLLGFVSGR